jgi:hypothetical protein
VRQQQVQDVGVGHRDDRVVGAGDDQHMWRISGSAKRLVQTDPASKLVQIAHPRAGQQLTLEKPLDDR